MPFESQKSLKSPGIAKSRKKKWDGGFGRWKRSSKAIYGNPVTKSFGKENTPTEPKGVASTEKVGSVSSSSRKGNIRRLVKPDHLISVDQLDL